MSKTEVRVGVLRFAIRELEHIQADAEYCYGKPFDHTEKLGKMAKNALARIAEWDTGMTGDAATPKDAADCKKSLESSPAPAQPTSGVDEKTLAADFAKRCGWPNRDGFQVTHADDISKAMLAFLREVESGRHPTDAQGEASVIDVDLLMNQIHAILRHHRTFCATVTLPESDALGEIRKAIRPHLRTTELEPEPTRCPTCQSGIKGDCGFHCDAGDSARSAEVASKAGVALPATEERPDELPEDLTPAVIDNYRRLIQADKNDQGQYHFFAAMADTLLAHIEQRQTVQDSSTLTAADKDMLLEVQAALHRIVTVRSHGGIKDIAENTSMKVDAKVAYLKLARLMERLGLRKRGADE